MKHARSHQFARACIIALASFHQAQRAQGPLGVGVSTPAQLPGLKRQGKGGRQRSERSEVTVAFK